MYSYKPRKPKVSANYKGKNPTKKAKREKKNPVCPVCGKPIKMVPFEQMDFRFSSKKHPDFYWVCSDYPACNTYAMADSRTGKPVGTLAGPRLRHLRRCIHEWQLFMDAEMSTDKKAFRSMCAYRLGMDEEKFHAANANELECSTILDYLQKLYETDEKVKNLINTRYFRSTIWKHCMGVDTDRSFGAIYDHDGNITGYYEGCEPETEKKPEHTIRESEENKNGEES